VPELDPLPKQDFLHHEIELGEVAAEVVVTLVDLLVVAVRYTLLFQMFLLEIVHYDVYWVKGLLELDHPF
jgi:hypothetical protein